MEITHNNKNYRWIGDKWGCLSITKEHKIIVNDFEWVELIPPESISRIITHHTPEQLVKLGYLEEVKENKEPPILEKLRSELEKDLKNRMDFTGGDEEDEFYSGYRCAIKVLTSLETKEPVHPLTEEVIVPEFDYEKITTLALEKEPNGFLATVLMTDKIGKHMEKVTQWIHSQSNK